MKALVLLLLVAGCGSKAVVYDREASVAYRVAWEKKMNGDPAGYRAALAEVAKKYPGTRAGERAKQRLKE